MAYVLLTCVALQACLNALQGAHLEGAEATTCCNFWKTDRLGFISRMSFATEGKCISIQNHDVEKHVIIKGIQKFVVGALCRWIKFIISVHKILATGCWVFVARRRELQLLAALLMPNITSLKLPPNIIHSTPLDLYSRVLLYDLLGQFNYRFQCYHNALCKLLLSVFPSRAAPHSFPKLWLPEVLIVPSHGSSITIACASPSVRHVG